LFCVECDNWKGPATRVAEHIEVCGQREHSCPQARYGCDWKGTASALLLHEPDCEWVPKACSHPGCQETVFSGTQKAHEETCVHRPVGLGALMTTAATAQRLREMRQFYRQDVSELEQLAPPQLRARVLQAAEFVPCLYDAVAAAVPTDIMENCPWGCGFSSPRSLMEGHYPHCQKFPVDCNFCAVKVARETLEIHAGICDERLVPCPRGCDARGVRFLDMESGLHERTCPQVWTRCQECDAEMLRQRLDIHLQTCARRRVSCGWCMDAHAAGTFYNTSQVCRRSAPTNPYIDDGALQIASHAKGAVYIRLSDRYDPVYVYLPAAVMRRELGAGVTGRNLTEGVSFMWKRVADTKVTVRYVPGGQYFSVGVSTSLPFGNDFRFEAKLYSRSGVWIDTMGKTDGARTTRPLMEMRLGETVNEGRITAYNRIASAVDDGFFLQLGPVYFNV
ncbi:MAG: hypothetical protein OXC07_08100, partial [Kistimonas sp.]|nr:hypothetical protein [Kistimonas sp.]